MDGFSFPPPPPPPPKASSSTQQEAPNQFNNRGGRGGQRGRGGRGSFRGRGGAPARGGGGNFQPQNTNNSGYGQNAGNYQSNYGNQRPQYPQQYQNNQQYPVPQQYQMPQQYQPPPGSYINPAFGNMQTQGYPQPQMPQYGQQNEFATGQTNQTSHANQNHATSPPREKRTRDQAFGHPNKSHPMKKPSGAAKAQVAPSVPSFGAPLLPSKPPASLPLDGNPKPRSQTTTLGLIPSTSTPLPDSEPEEISDDDEEIDEEATLSALSTAPLTFEFNGEFSTLSSTSEIASWIQERKKRWPSKRRIEEKEKEVESRMQERKRIEEETRAAIAVASGGEYVPLERRDRQQRITTKSERQEEDPSLEAANQPTLPDKDSDSDSDAPPEQTSTKLTQPLRIPPPPPPPSSSTSKPSLSSTPKPCTSFLNTGRCKFGNKCRYKHDSTSSSSSQQKRKTLFQRLVDQEMDEENRLALQAIKYLGGVGFFSKHASTA